MRPSKAVLPSKARVLAACFHADPLNVRTVAQLAHVSVQRTFVLLRELRDEGMVDWADGKLGTWRLTCAIGTPRKPSFDILGSYSDSGLGAALTAPGPATEGITSMTEPDSTAPRPRTSSPEAG
jgi:hypothetical protein